MKTLYVEDHEVNRLLLQISLKDLTQLDLAIDGTEGIQKALKGNYDIIILDLNLGDPDLDGFGVLKELKPKLTINPVFVALTAYSGEEWEAKCIDSGFDLYFSKPCNPVSMFKEIEEFKKR